MTRKTPLLPAMLLVMGSAVIALFIQAQAAIEHEHAHQDAQHDDHEHAHGGEHADEIPRGPHGGRLLSADNFALEITLYETGVRPEFHVYPYADKAPLSPAEVDLHIELARLGNQVDTFEFSPQDDYLRGHGSVSEPHSL